MNLWIVFLTGLTTGGLSCLAMQGGLLASIIANQKERELEKKTVQTTTFSFDQLDWLPVCLFLATKLIAHTLLGFLLGWLGSRIEFSLTLRLLFQAFAAFFMLATAGNLLELHPVFRYVVFQPPKFLQKIVRNSTKSSALFTPAVLGMLTIFIPCGVTQAMEVLAVSSGNPISGAAIMFTFVLGTSPIFGFVGVATAKLSEAFTKNFMKIAAATLIFLGLSSLNGILVVLDSPLTFEKLSQPIVSFFSPKQNFSDQMDTVATPIEGVQQIRIFVGTNGYTPNRVRVYAGVPVQLTVQTQNSYSCANSFILRAFKISLELAPNDIQTVTFTPTQKGTYQFTCSMGMYTGTLEVI